MSTISVNWGSWNTTSINSSSITNSSTSTTAVIATTGSSAVEVSVTCTYGGTATAGLVVNILRQADGTPNYESASTDSPFGFALPFSTSTTMRRVISVAADRISAFEVACTNNSGASVTVTVNYRLATVQIV